MYLDRDDSLTTTAADTFQNSLIACNGSNGAQGLQGVPGDEGPQGIAGEVGPAGADGLNGQDGTNGTNGTDGLAGLQGPVGPQGPAGPQGLQGIPGADGSSATASIVVFNSSSCQSVTGTLYFTKPNGSHNSFYTGNTCNNGSKVYDMAAGGSFWLSMSKLAVDVTSGGIRVITFN